MKIKLAILENDQSYLKRIVSVFGTKYEDKLELYSFTDVDTALGMLDTARIDVLIAGETFDVDIQKIPNRCAFAYFVNAVGVDMYNDQPAICKFQKADLIYKQILSIYSEKASNILGFKMDGTESKVIVVCSASGGVGSSTVAAAYATRRAAQGNKVLYLNLEKYGGSDVFFQGQGNYDMSDIIYALKSRTVNLPMKLESCVKKDASGVHFYSQAKIALDMMEMTTADAIRLISELKVVGGYDYLVLDTDFALDKEMLQIYRLAQTIVFVGDGSVESNAKTERAITALTLLEQKEDAPLINRSCFLYNKISSGQQINVGGLKILGGTHKYTGSTRQIVSQLAGMAVLDGIM